MAFRPYDLVLVVGAVLLLPAQAAGWISQIDGTQSFGDHAEDVVVGPSGEVFVGGSLVNQATEDDFLVVKFDASDGSELWRVELDGSEPGFNDDDVWALASVGADVVAVGSLKNAGTRADCTVVRFDGTSGAELWRQEIDGGALRDDRAFAVAVDGNGDVVVGGGLTQVFADGSDFAVLKFDGASGAELWRAVIDVSGNHDRAVSIAIDSNGDVIAGGILGAGVADADFAIAKFDGASGAELWRHQIDGGTNAGSEIASSVAVDANDDVVASGVLNADGEVFKFDGATGAQSWRTTLVGTGAGDDARRVVLNASGDVFVAGHLGNPTPVFSDFAVVRLDGASGAELWRQTTHGAAKDTALDIALDPAGDPVVVGTLSSFGGAADDEFAVMKFDAATGTEQWRQVLRGKGDGNHVARAVAVDTNGDVIAAGSLDGGATSLDVAVVKLDGADGSTRGLGGRTLVVKDPGDPTKRQMRFVVKDDFVMSGLPGSIADPTVSGATLRLVNPTTLEEATFGLAAAGWKGLGTPAGAKGYRYLGTLGGGPCKKVVIKPTKQLKAVCTGKSGLLPFTLDEPSQDSLVISLRVGTTAPLCSRFGGVKIDVPGLFKASQAPAEGLICP